nr:hypothetical protein [Tanacetum cinerariifolium]
MAPHHKPSMHYLNIIMRNAVKVFRKETIPGSGNGVCGSAMLMEEEEIVKLMKEEEMADLELQVYGNVTHQEMADEEALNLTLAKEARQARTEHEWLEKCRQEEEEEAFVGFLRDQCAGLRMTNSNNQRLIAELEAFGEQGDVVRRLDHIREIVTRDFTKLGVLEQLLARTHVGIGLKDSYVADIEENE